MVRNAKKSYEIDMCSGAILPKLLRFSVPLTLSTMLQLLFNAADVVVVGRFAGDNSLAAVGSNTALINLLTNLFLGLSIGANILAARHYGAHEEEELRKTVHTSVLLAIVSGIVLSVIGVAGARDILILMQCPEEVLGLATLYLRIYFAGMTATMLYNFGAALLRAGGDTQRPLYYLLLAGIVNLVLNLIFVIQFRMDVAGVALATVISQCISAALVIRCLIWETGALHLDLHQLKICPIKLRQIMQVGIPAGIQGCLFSLANVTVQSAINSFQDTAIIAGSSAASSVENFIYANINSFYQANTAFTSQNYGAGNVQRIKRIMWISVLTGTLSTLMLSLVTYAAGPPLLGIYSPSPEVIAAGMVRLRWILLFYALDAVMDVQVGSLRGMGYNMLPMLVTLIGACLFRLVWLATVFRIPAYHSIETVYMVYPISWVITASCHAVCFFLTYRKLSLSSRRGRAGDGDAGGRVLNHLKCRKRPFTESVKGRFLSGFPLPASAALIRPCAPGTLRRADPDPPPASSDPPRSCGRQSPRCRCRPWC